ncbi:MAG: HAD-IA family hydrolase [Candidatus Brennerbacteria bacterium]|nr:HAD-IA family hydrolase [Candidatus Brennerbacteria bacterium]
MIKRIITDLGGVIIHTDSSKFFKILREYHCGDSNDNFEFMFSVIPFHKLFSIGLISPLEFYDSTCRFLRVIIDYEDFVDAWNEILLKPNEKYCEFLKHVNKAGYAISLLSNIDKIHWKKVCEIEIIRDIFDCFDTFALSYLMGCAKPDPVIFEKTFALISAVRPECVFIDDKLENIQTAKSLGIPSILYNSEKHEEFLVEFKKLCPDFLMAEH